MLSLGIFTIPTQILNPNDENPHSPNKLVLKFQYLNFDSVP